MNTTNTIRPNLAADINKLCEQAHDKADEAVGFAMQAGKLLLEAKSALAHGEWLPWLQQNIWVTPRQAQRYMQAAQGKAATPRRQITAEEIKNDTVSHLDDWLPRPAFIPIKGYAHLIWSEGQPVYLIEPSAQHPGFFFAMVMRRQPDGSADVDYTRRPMAADFVEHWLKSEGMGDPSSADWMLHHCAGVDVAGAMLGFTKEPA